MVDDGQQPMQAAGPGINPEGANEGAGESGGGAYPNPHSKTSKRNLSGSGEQDETDRKITPDRA